MKLQARLVEKVNDILYVEIAAIYTAKIIKITSQDLRNSRCGLEDYLENMALDYAETLGVARDRCKVELKGVTKWMI